jgi:hypothetical protein
VPELQQLRADHAPAVLAFELANRAVPSLLAISVLMAVRSSPGSAR